MPCVTLALALVCQSLPTFAEDAIPSAFGKDRYEALRTKSPFAVATAVVAPPAPQASFAANWYVSGVGRIDDDYYVSIKSRDLSTQFTLYAGQTVDGVTVASVNWSDQIGKSTVVLRKGTETAKLEFNEAQLHGPATTAAAIPVPGAQPKPVGVAANVPHPVGVNMAAANPGMVAPVPNGVPINGSPVQRRRVLPIPQPR
jgi:hypothetical protein